MTTPSLGPVRFGRTGFDVTPLSLGTSSWGAPRPGESAGDETRRIGALADAFVAGELATNLLDTSNAYGASRSEGFIGAALAAAGGLREGLVIQTKLDRDPATEDFSAARMQRSLEESLERLGLDTLPVLYLHDPEHIGFDAAMRDGVVDALVAMKERGLAASIGISGGPVGMLQQFVETDLFDALVTHNRYTLVDRSAGALLDAAAARDVGVTNAAPYGGGVLTGDPRFAGTYGYAPITPTAQAAVTGIERVCNDFSVPLAAAALWFSIREPRIHSTIVGKSSREQWDATVAELDTAPPEDFWAAVEDVVPAGIALDA
jgi:D-threo-aldose 1-dehydrogenase